MTRTARFAWGAVVVIIVGVVVLLIDALGGTTTAKRSTTPPPTSPAVVQAVSHVPAPVFSAVGISAATPLTAPEVLPHPRPFSAGGKPDVLFVGAEFCPFCAAERWPLVVALSRFGRFTVLRNATSSPDAVFPSTASFSFDHSSYTSPYLTFTGVELYSSTPTVAGPFAPLAHLTTAQAALVVRAGGRTTGGMPFVDIGGTVVATAAAFSPAVLATEGQGTVAADLTDAHAPTTQAIVAAANELTAAICSVTNQQPKDVCASDGVIDARVAMGLPAA